MELFSESVKVWINLGCHIFVALYFINSLCKLEDQIEEDHKDIQKIKDRLEEL